MNPRKDQPSTPTEIVLYPPGIALYLLATLSMVISHSCILISLYVLFVMPFPGHHEFAGLIMLFAATSLFVVIHPSFMITRGRKKSVQVLNSISLVYTALLGVILAWSLYSDGPLVYFSVMGFFASGLAVWSYRNKKLERLREYYASLWGDRRLKRGQSSEKF